MDSLFTPDSELFCGEDDVLTTHMVSLAHILMAHVVWFLDRKPQSLPNSCSHVENTPLWLSGMLHKTAIQKYII